MEEGMPLEQSLEACLIDIGVIFDMADRLT